VKVIIVGAGEQGAVVADALFAMQRAGSPVEVLCFVDDDPAKAGRRISGVPVLDTAAALEQIIRGLQADLAIIARPTVPPNVVRQVVDSLEHHKRQAIETTLDLGDLLKGRVTVSALRSLSAKDLLARPPVGLPPERLRSLIAGKRVLVTGAGGSIGSELCRQAAALDPSHLVMLDHYENGLFSADRGISQGWPNIDRDVVVASVADAERVDAVMRRYTPEIVFHAAAHKHVPLMEANRCEAVRNNVFATRVLAETADRYETERFVFISTDKAVNPISVMGATKRVAERMLQHLSAGSRTCLTAVRFGNVLNSNGSVVPVFLDQIKRGGPVTVTHPEMRRFFMLIPEAVQLVLHAATLGTSGAIYMLEMGEQVNITDMARNLIRLSGFVPDEDIRIVYTGLRPGEKLFEELVGSDESAVPAGVEKVQRILSAVPPDDSMFESQLRDLELAASRDDDGAVTGILQRMVPTFTPMPFEPSGTSLLE
jgi:FlaA1/EpsC-like NDP-sugar epimerase